MVFSDIASSNVSLALSGQNLVITVTSTGKTVTVLGQFNNIGLGNLQSFTFADGVTWTAAQVGVLVNADTVFAGTGDKTLNGRGRALDYVYSSAGGNDTINDGTSLSRLTFLDINPSGVSLSRSGSSRDLQITILATGKVLTVSGQFNGLGLGNLQSFTFADGTVWTAAQIKQMVLAAEEAVPNGSVYGYPQSNDTLVAGPGNQYLSGQGGADTYVYSSAGGSDIIDDGGSASRMVFTDINASGVSLSRSGSSRDLQITILATGKVLSVWGQFNGLGFGNLQTFTFADGTVWTAAQVMQMVIAQQEAVPNGSVYGFPGINDTLVAGPGNQYLSGQGGADTYVYSSAGGNDIIDDGGSSSRMVFSNINPSGVSLSRSGTSRDLQITILATGKVLSIWGQFNGLGFGNLQSFTFADGTVWTATQVKQMLLAQEAAVPGGAIFGYPQSNDTLVAGTGDQYLSGQGGADTYVYSSAGGNITVDDGGSSSRMVFSDINAANVTLSKVSGNTNLVVTDTITGHTVTVLGQFSNGSGTLQSFTFADGTVWTAAQVSAMAWYRGTSGNDTLGGSGANDTFASSPGIDTLNGNGGFDSYEFSPTFGQTTINNLASDGVTTPRGEIDFGAGIASNQLWFLQSGNNLQIDVLGTNEQVTAAGWFAGNARAQVQTITAADTLKLDTGVAQLVSAMATYSANNASFNPTTATQMPTDTNLQAAVAAAWHH
jgi:Ca2+-binding RTX toxin-like protein